jgi:hypothetical protein
MRIVFLLISLTCTAYEIYGSDASAAIGWGILTWLISRIR